MNPAFLLGGFPHPPEVRRGAHRVRERLFGYLYRLPFQQCCEPRPFFMRIRVLIPSLLKAKEVSLLTSVHLRSNESQEQLLRRFRKKVAKSGVLSTVRRKRWFISKSELRRIQKKKAVRRHRRRGSDQ
jgi:small subunit ribosomal protein S21